MNHFTMPHDRIVTPETDPDRFDEDEAASFWRGVCGQTGYGYYGTEICGRPSKPGASFGNCDEHEADLLECHWPDGTPRHDLSGPDYDRRVQAKLEAHQRNCDDTECYCRG